MLQAAAKAPTLLREGADRAAEFILGCLNDDGGFRGRDRGSDLYFTAFALSSLLALKARFPHRRVVEYLHSFGAGEKLDFVHLAALVRCWISLSEDPGANASRGVVERIERCRSRDGGYNQFPQGRHGTAYACFLALGAYQDLGAEIPDVAGLARCVGSLRSTGGGYGNSPDMEIGSTPATAAAVTILRELDQNADDSVGRWLLERCWKGGGFLATPAAPIPDLLSTATALHALAGLGINLKQIKEPSLDFIDTLWDPRGGFRAYCADEELDCEYTFYGLLALGHLGD
jgi:prenyltransferase beta subunit